MRLVIVAVSDVGRSHEQREWIFLLGIQETSLCHFFDLLHSLPSMTAQIEVFLVTPQNGRPCFHHRLGQHVVQVHHLFSSTIAHHHEQAALSCLHASFHERANAAVHLLAHRRNGNHTKWPSARRRLLPIERQTQL